MKLYGIRDKVSKKLLSFRTEAYEDDGAQMIVYKLTEDSFHDYFWLVTKREIAEEARKTNASWFVADYETPVNKYRPDDLEVIEFEFPPSNLYELVTGNLDVDTSDLYENDEEVEKG
jgi:hypothetical protein